MSNDKKMKVFLVDDDSVFLRLLEIEFLQHADFDIETYATGELCLEHLDNKPDVIILDYHLDGVQKNAMTGIETLDKIKVRDANIPVVVLSSQDKIEVAVDCMHHQAYDYVVKSETAFMRLQANIKKLMYTRKIEKELMWYMDRM